MFSFSSIFLSTSVFASLAVSGPTSVVPKAGPEYGINTVFIKGQPPTVTWSQKALDHENMVYNDAPREPELRDGRGGSLRSGGGRFRFYSTSTHIITQFAKKLPLWINASPPDWSSLSPRMYTAR
ncbi:hypothetical protein PHLCEN_2v846 [Hermanssonia centrifuga]|uniref:Uncharacterized protein n=1 Tax=Hermanssonia centrifuga TaxID=98765 RepID=A0A2R6S572_9APHY|nr:hypothetical protein PHLCEN_2v846 [Hermanssonia centrifuga]